MLRPFGSVAGEGPGPGNANTAAAAGGGVPGAAEGAERGAGAGTQRLHQEQSVPAGARQAAADGCRANRESQGTCLNLAAADPRLHVQSRIGIFATQRHASFPLLTHRAPLLEAAVISVDD